jgi:hypothetical protein
MERVRKPGISLHCQTHFSKNMLDRTPGELPPDLKVALTDLDDEELGRRERAIRILPGETSMVRLMGSILMEMHEKWMPGKSSFSMKRYKADREEARKAMQPDRNKLNHTDQLTA